MVYSLLDFFNGLYNDEPVSTTACISDIEITLPFFRILK